MSVCERESEWESERQTLFSIHFSSLCCWKVPFLHISVVSWKDGWAVPPPPHLPWWSQVHLCPQTHFTPSRGPVRSSSLSYFLGETVRSALWHLPLGRWSSVGRSGPWSCSLSGLPDSCCCTVSSSRYCTVVDDSYGSRHESRCCSDRMSDFSSVKADALEHTLLWTFYPITHPVMWPSAIMTKLPKISS